jgi:hypothetical protein
MPSLLVQYHAAEHGLVLPIAAPEFSSKPCFILPPVARKQRRAHGKPSSLIVLNILFRSCFVPPFTHVKISEGWTRFLGAWDLQSAKGVQAFLDLFYTRR